MTATTASQPYPHRWPNVLADRLISAQRGLRRRIRQHGIQRLSENDFAQRLESLGVRSGRAVLVHSSWEALTAICAFNPAGIIDILREAVGSTGTLAMPVLPFTGSMKDYLAGASKPIAVSRQPARNGLLSELFRRTPGVYHSLHPTHAVCALGDGAEELVADHLTGPLPFGPTSPYAKLADMDGVVLGLGVNYRFFSSFHQIESCYMDEAAAATYFDPIMNVDCVDEVRGQWTQPVRPFRPGVGRCFFRMYLEMKRSRGVRDAYHGKTPLMSIDAAVMNQVLRSAAERRGHEAVAALPLWQMAEKVYLTDY